MYYTENELKKINRNIDRKYKEWMKNSDLEILL